MAMSMKSALRSAHLFRRSLCACSCSNTLAQQRGKASWSKLFKKTDQPPVEEWSPPNEVRRSGPEDGPSTVSRLESLRKKEGLVSIRGYDPPKDVADTVTSIAHAVLGKSVDPHTPLDDRKTKFELLTRLMSEFDHYISNTELNDLHTVDDLIVFFSTPVKERSSYEDLAKLDLPPNLHIQMEPVRFQAETDTFFDGQTAFPGRGTIISSLKFRRKYTGNEGESRNRPNRTRYEETVMYTRKT